MMSSEECKVFCNIRNICKLQYSFYNIYFGNKATFINVHLSTTHNNNIMEDKKKKEDPKKTNLKNAKPATDPKKKMDSNKKPDLKKKK